jgi:hypothetical protein
MITLPVANAPSHQEARAPLSIRDYTNGSTANTSNHWVEFQGWESSTTAFTDGLTWLFQDHLGSTSVSQPAVGGAAVT